MGRGDHGLEGEELREESLQLIKYFLAVLTVPEKEMWVNLSPYEKNRIFTDKFGMTQMGRDLLAQDYLLKQLTASLMYPEEELGQTFWNQVYSKAQELYGTTDIPVNTFNKVWIVPSKAVVMEEKGTAVIVESHLKVMLEEDYVALQESKNVSNESLSGLDGASQDTMATDVSSQIIRDVIIPAIEKEVNEGENFAQLRQIYNAVILGAWYKQSLKDGLLHRVYVDQNKIKGVDYDDPTMKDKIYQQYLKAFEKGVYDYIREDLDPISKEPVLRKYFSGGFRMDVGSSGVLQVVPRSAVSASSAIKPSDVLARAHFLEGQVPDEFKKRGGGLGVGASSSGIGGGRPIIPPPVEAQASSAVALQRVFVEEMRSPRFSDILEKNDVATPKLFSWFIDESDLETKVLENWYFAIDSQKLSETLMNQALNELVNDDSQVLRDYYDWQTLGFDGSNSIRGDFNIRSFIRFMQEQLDYKHERYRPNHVFQQVSEKLMTGLKSFEQDRFPEQDYRPLFNRIFNRLTNKKLPKDSKLSKADLKKYESLLKAKMFLATVLRQANFSNRDVPNSNSNGHTVAQAFAHRASRLNIVQKNMMKNHLLKFLQTDTTKWESFLDKEAASFLRNPQSDVNAKIDVLVSELGSFNAVNLNSAMRFIMNNRRGFHLLNYLTMVAPQESYGKGIFDSDSNLFLLNVLNDLTKEIEEWFEANPDADANSYSSLAPTPGLRKQIEMVLIAKSLLKSTDIKDFLSIKGSNNISFGKFLIHQLKNSKFKSFLISNFKFIFSKTPRVQSNSYLLGTLNQIVDAHTESIIDGKSPFIFSNWAAKLDSNDGQVTVQNAVEVLTSLSDEEIFWTFNSLSKTLSVPEESLMDSLEDTQEMLSLKQSDRIRREQADRVARFFGVLLKRSDEELFNDSLDAQSLEAQVKKRSRMAQIKSLLNNENFRLPDDTNILLVHSNPELRRNTVRAVTTLSSEPVKTWTVSDWLNNHSSRVVEAVGEDKDIKDIVVSLDGSLINGYQSGTDEGQQLLNSLMDSISPDTWFVIADEGEVDLSQAQEQLSLLAQDLQQQLNNKLGFSNPNMRPNISLEGFEEYSANNFRVLGVFQVNVGFDNSERETVRSFVQNTLKLGKNSQGLVLGATDNSVLLELANQHNVVNVLPLASETEVNNLESLVRFSSKNRGANFSVSTDSMVEGLDKLSKTMLTESRDFVIDLSGNVLDATNEVEMYEIIERIGLSIQSGGRIMLSASLPKTNEDKRLLRAKTQRVSEILSGAIESRGLGLLTNNPLSRKKSDDVFIKPNQRTSQFNETYAQSKQTVVLDLSVTSGKDVIPFPSLTASSAVVGTDGKSLSNPSIVDSVLGREDVLLVSEDNKPLWIEHLYLGLTEAAKKAEKDFSKHKWLGLNPHEKYKLWRIKDQATKVLEKFKDAVANKEIQYLPPITNESLPSFRQNINEQETSYFINVNDSELPDVGLLNLLALDLSKSHRARLVEFYKDNGFVADSMKKMFSYLPGFIATGVKPIADKGIFKMMEKGPVTMKEIAEKVGDVNKGVLHMVLYDIAGLGWIDIKEPDIKYEDIEHTKDLQDVQFIVDKMEYSFTDKGRSLLDYIPAYTRVAELTQDIAQMQAYLEGNPSQGPPELFAELIEEMKNNWNIPLSLQESNPTLYKEILDQLNGFIVGPTILAMRYMGIADYRDDDPERSTINKFDEFNRLNLDELTILDRDSELHPKLDENGKEQSRSVTGDRELSQSRLKIAFDGLQHLGFFETEGNFVRKTSMGTAHFKRAQNYPVPVSYFPSYAKAEQLMFGDLDEIQAQWFIENRETMVDRAANVEGSGDSHKIYFPAINKAFQMIIDRMLKASEIPSVEAMRERRNEKKDKFKKFTLIIADTGSGDGRYLSHLFKDVVMKSVYRRLIEKHGDLYDNKMVGVDYNEGPQIKTKQRLDDADINNFTMFGDINEPQDIHAALKQRLEDEGYGQDDYAIIHTNTMLFHNRPFYRKSADGKVIIVEDWEAAKQRVKDGKVKIRGAFSTTDGLFIPNFVNDQNYLELMKRWRTVAKDLVTVELFGLTYDQTSEKPSETLNPAYAYSHHLSFQNIFRLPAAVELMEEAGYSVNVIQKWGARGKETVAAIHLQVSSSISFSQIKRNILALFSPVVSKLFLDREVFRQSTINHIRNEQVRTFKAFVERFMTATEELFNEMFNIDQAETIELGDVFIKNKKDLQLYEVFVVTDLGDNFSYLGVSLMEAGQGVRTEVLTKPQLTSNDWLRFRIKQNEDLSWNNDTLLPHLQDVFSSILSPSENAAINLQRRLLNPKKDSNEVVSRVVAKDAYSGRKEIHLIIEKVVDNFDGDSDGFLNLIKKLNGGFIHDVQGVNFMNVPENFKINNFNFLLLFPNLRTLYFDDSSLSFSDLSQLKAVLSSRSDGGRNIQVYKNGVLQGFDFKQASSSLNFKGFTNSQLIDEISSLLSPAVHVPFISSSHEQANRFVFNARHSLLVEFIVRNRQFMGNLRNNFGAMFVGPEGGFRFGDILVKKVSDRPGDLEYYLVTQDSGASYLARVNLEDGSVEAFNGRTVADTDKTIGNAYRSPEWVHYRIIKNDKASISEIFTDQEKTVIQLQEYFQGSLPLLRDIQAVAFIDTTFLDLPNGEGSLDKKIKLIVSNVAKNFPGDGHGFLRRFYGLDNEIKGVQVVDFRGINDANFKIEDFEFLLQFPDLETILFDINSFHDFIALEDVLNSHPQGEKIGVYSLGEYQAASSSASSPRKIFSSLDLDGTSQQFLHKEILSLYSQSVSEVFEDDSDDLKSAIQEERNRILLKFSQRFEAQPQAVVRLNDRDSLELGDVVVSGDRLSFFVLTHVREEKYLFSGIKSNGSLEYIDSIELDLSDKVWFQYRVKELDPLEEMSQFFRKKKAKLKKALIHLQDYFRNPLKSGNQVVGIIEDVPQESLPMFEVSTQRVVLKLANVRKNFDSLENYENIINNPQHSLPNVFGVDFQGVQSDFAIQNFKLLTKFQDLRVLYFDDVSYSEDELIQFLKHHKNSNMIKVYKNGLILDLSLDGKMGASPLGSQQKQSSSSAKDIKKMHLTQLEREIVSLLSNPIREALGLGDEGNNYQQEDRQSDIYQELSRLLLELNSRESQNLLRKVGSGEAMLSGDFFIEEGTGEESSESKIFMLMNTLMANRVSYSGVQFSSEGFEFVTMTNLEFTTKRLSHFKINTNVLVNYEGGIPLFLKPVEQAKVKLQQHFRNAKRDDQNKSVGVVDSIPLPMIPTFDISPQKLQLNIASVASNFDDPQDFLNKFQDLDYEIKGVKVVDFRGITDPNFRITDFSFLLKFPDLKVVLFNDESLDEDEVRKVLDLHRNSSRFTINKLRVFNKDKEVELNVFEGKQRASSTPLGGINLDSDLLDLQIKRNGEGVPLPLDQQPLESMVIEGFTPIIINILPVNLPLLMGGVFNTANDSENTQLSYERPSPMDKLSRKDLPLAGFVSNNDSI